VLLGACVFLAGVPLLAIGSRPQGQSGDGSILVNGVVKDGAGQGWPLYARLVVSGPGFPGATLFSDPVTGYYAIELEAGVAYDFVVTAVAPGYVPGGGSLNLLSTAQNALVANWSLLPAPSCNAPGFGPGSFVEPLVLSEGFDGGVIPPGWSVQNIFGSDWTVSTGADPCGQFPGNQTGGSGPYAIVNNFCDGPFSGSFLVTPPMDLSASANAVMQWANDFVDLGSGTLAVVDVSIDGGENWTTVWQAPGDLPGPSTQVVDISFAAGHAGVLARFHYEGVFAYWWQVDDVKVGAFACSTLSGGLVVGTVSNANTGGGVNGATVTNLPDDGSTTSFATPDDPAQGDGFYILFAGSGPQPFEASAALYDPQTKSTAVIPNGAVRLDFTLPAGSIDASPRPLAALVSAGGAQDLILTLTNAGGKDGSFHLQEIDLPPSTPAASARLADSVRRTYRVPFDRLNDPNLRDLPAPANAPVAAPVLANAGNVVQSFSSGLVGGWGMAFDTGADRLWITNPENFGGDGLEYEYLPDGTPTGETIDLHGAGGFWQADGTYNARTGMLWHVDVGEPGCLFEVDPVAKVVTGNTICGPWEGSQRTVTHDYATDTYYVGSTNDTRVFRIDGSGALRGIADLGVTIAGLAYNPTTQHLFVASGFASPFDVWIFDSVTYAALGGFRVTSNGVPVLQNGGVSLDADCGGRLWINDSSAQTIYQFESGETGWCVNDIPWLSENPTEGTVPGGGELPVTVTFDSQGLLPGLHQGSLLFATDTPGSVDPVPVDLTVLFNDVPQDSFAWNFIYGAAGAGVMQGCAPQTPTFLFCPNEVVTRRSMAGYIERAVHGALTPPPVYLGGFDDVLPGSFNANYIQGLVEDGITAGCSDDPPLYCPDVPVTRAQMAVFIWKGEHGVEPPPPCSPPGTFADVPCPNGFAVDYVQGIFSEGITAGCDVGPPALFCPDASITSAELAVFLVKAFQIPYLP